MALNEVKKFITDRKLDEMEYNDETYTINVLEEMIEKYKGIDSQKARQIATTVYNFMLIQVDSETDSELVSVPELKESNGLVDSICDNIVYSIDALMKLGYDPECVLKETAKEINSRRQDPEQKKRWNNNDIKPGEKWQKDLNQPEEEKYKADYTKCKR